MNVVIKVNDEIKEKEALYEEEWTELSLWIEEAESPS